MKVSYACWLGISKCSFLSVIRRNCCFRGWKKSHRPGILRKECLHGIYILWCLTAVGETAVKRWSSENVKKKKSVWRRCIYWKYVSWSRLQNSNEDVLLSTDHVVLLANGCPRLNIYGDPPSLFREQVA